jgi:hypothetical protein
MGTEQVPEVRQSFSDLRALFEEISQIHMTLALAEDRTAEDWRDVIERYSVVFRVNDAHNEQKFLFDSETQSLAETQRRIEASKLRKGKPDTKAVREEEKKQRQLSRVRRTYIRMLSQLIETKLAYNKFKVNRVRHGFVLYAAALKEACEQEMGVFVRMRTLIESMDLDCGAQRQIAEQLERPAPVAIPTSFKRRNGVSGSGEEDGIECFSEDEDPTPVQQPKPQKQEPPKKRKPQRAKAPKPVLPTVEHSSDGEEDDGAEMVRDPKPVLAGDALDNWSE